jgi:hypothetical protein
MLTFSSLSLLIGVTLSFKFLSQIVSEVPSGLSLLQLLAAGLDWYPSANLQLRQSILDRLPSSTNWLAKSKSKSKLYYDRWWVSHSVMVSRTHLRPKTWSVLFSDSCEFQNHHFEQLLHCYIRVLLSVGPGIVAFLWSSCLAMDVFLASYSSSHASCHSL